jgi:peroxiredoxin
MPAEIGSPAPDFSLPDTDGETVSRDDFGGRKTLLVFIPFPFTGTCGDELCTLRDHLADLNELDANVVAITCDTRFANARWSEENGFGFPVLSDFWPHGAVAKDYGTFNPKTGSNNRVTFVLDAEGIVREIVASGSLGTPREYDEYVAALQRI